MTFAELMATNPARLVVQYTQARDGSEQFQWGVVGKIPVMNLIGGVARAQADLTGGKWIPGCESDPAAFVLVWHPEERRFEHFVHRDIPADPLVGMLKVIEAIMVDSRLAQHAASQTRILGPDGNPMRL